MNFKILILSLALAMTTPGNTSDILETKLERAQENEVKISFAGDCTLGTFKGQGGNNLFTNYYETYGESHFFENVYDIFVEDDITFVNLEGPLTQYEQTAIKTFPIKGEPEYVNMVKNASIEVCNMANNHTFDCGELGFNDTLTNLDSVGVGYCGEGYVHRMTQNNIPISFLGYRAFNVDDNLKMQIKQDIEHERANGSKLICVMFHYGIEREYYSNVVQEDISRYTIDCGADIVLGGHPHVIQGIEKYKGKTICYSLGNFSFGANKNPSDKDTFIFSQTFCLNENGDVEYGESEIIPCSISSKQDTNDYKPTPLSGEDKERVLNRLKEYSSKYEHSYFD